MFKFKRGQRLKLQVSKGEKKSEIFNCRVCGIYENCILVKRKNYKECLLLSNFITGDIKVLGGNFNGLY